MTTDKKTLERQRGYQDGMAMSLPELNRIYDAIFEASYTGDDLLDHFEIAPSTAYFDGIEQAYQMRGDI